MFSANNATSFVTRLDGMHASDVRETVAADDGTVYSMFFTGPAGIQRRVNGAWSPADNAELVTKFGSALNVMDAATAAQNSQRVFLADQGAGLWRSDNGGDDRSPVTSDS